MSRPAQRPAPAPAPVNYLVHRGRVWHGNTELNSDEIRAFAAHLTGLVRRQDEAAIRNAYPIDTEVWLPGRTTPYRVIGYTTSPGLSPSLRLSENTIARPEEVTRTPPHHAPQPR